MLNNNYNSSELLMITISQSKLFALRLCKFFDIINAIDFFNYWIYCQNNVYHCWQSISYSNFLHWI